MSLSGPPGSSREAATRAFPAGATVAVRIRDGVGGTFLARTVLGVVEDVTVGTHAVHRKTIMLPTDAGQYLIVWDDGTTIDTEELLVTYTAAADQAPSGRDLCSLADVIGYVPAYVPNDQTDSKLQQLITAESQLIQEEAGREIVPVEADQPATRTFLISDTATRLRAVAVGDLASLDGLEVNLLDRDGDVADAVDLAAVLPLYDGKPSPVSEWEPITALGFPWGRTGAPTPYSWNTLQVTGHWGFPAIPAFIREACAKRVILRYVSDVATAGTTFADAVGDSDLNLAAMFRSAQDAIEALNAGGIVIA